MTTKTIAIDLSKIRRLRFLLLLSLLIFALHAGLVVAIIFGVGAREDALRKISRLESAVISAETEFLVLDSGVTRELAQSRGYIDADRRTAFARASTPTVALSLP